MHNQFVYGYGSLVNRATHAYSDSRPGRLNGWRRVWRHTTLRPLAYLTVEPDPHTTIDGLVIQVAHSDADLAARERAYEQTDVSHQVIGDRLPGAKVQVFNIPAGRHGKPTEDHPVLLSYIDTVVQGYLREFGEAGAAAFFTTTDGWDAPILDDRDKPIYSRAQVPSAAEAAFVDDWLGRFRARRLRR